MDKHIRVQGGEDEIVRLAHFVFGWPSVSHLSPPCLDMPEPIGGVTLRIPNATGGMAADGRRAARCHQQHRYVAEPTARVLEIVDLSVEPTQSTIPPSAIPSHCVASRFDLAGVKNKRVVSWPPRRQTNRTSVFHLKRGINMGFQP